MIALLWLLACASPGETWHVVWGEDAVLGTEHRVVDGDTELRERRWRFDVGGQPVRTLTRTVIVRDTDGAALSVETERAGQVQRCVPAVPAPLLDDGLGSGEPFTALDPEACVLREVTRDGEAWTRDDGLSGTAEVVDGVLVAVRAGPLSARRGPAPRGPVPDLLELVRHPTERLEHAPGAWTARLRVTGLTVPEHPGQERVGDVVTVRVPLRAELAAEPVRCADPALAGWLVAEPPPESLAELAGRAGGATTRRLAVDHLVAHLSALEQVPSLRARSLAEVGARGVADCGDRAAALVTLARGIGVPARRVCGLAYLDGSLAPGLYPHEWAEVWLAGRWVPVDPTLGQVPAGAVRLVLGCEVSVWATAAEAKVDVLEAR